MSPEEVKKYLSDVSGWSAVEDKKSASWRIRREFKFEDFKEAMRFVNKAADVAESEGHHPDIHIFYNRVNIELWTHAVEGLSENDFILAAKINEIRV